MQTNRKTLVPLILLFVVLNALFIAGRTTFEKWGFDQEVLLAGNLFLFVITFFSYLIAKKGLQNSNPHAFVRSVFTSMIVKLFITVAAAFIYIATYRSNINKQALFTLMALYLVYTFIEVTTLTKQLRNRNNA